MRVVIVVTVFFMLLSCSDGMSRKGCKANADCRSSRVCDVVTQTCVDVEEDVQALPVEIVFVVNNSPGMCDFNYDLRESVKGFVETLEAARLRYSVAVITTGLGPDGKVGHFQYVPSVSTRGPDPCTHEVDISQCPGVTGEHSYAWLSSEDPYYQDSSGGVDVDRFQQHLACNLTVGTDGAWFELGLEAARGALLDARQRRFFQSGAVLALIYFSKENDCSGADDLGFLSTEQCERGREQLVPVDEYVEFFKNGLEPSPRSVLAFGIIAPDDGQRYESGERVPESACASAPNWSMSGYRYDEFISAFNGTSYNICDPPYDGALREIASAIGEAARQ